jgi:hypothetical protein
MHARTALVLLVIQKKLLCSIVMTSHYHGCAVSFLGIHDLGAQQQRIHNRAFVTQGDLMFDINTLAPLPPPQTQKHSHQQASGNEGNPTKLKLTHGLGKCADNSKHHMSRR